MTPPDLVIDIPGLPRMMNPSGVKSTHWTYVKRERDRWKRDVASICFAEWHRPPLRKARVRFTRFSLIRPDFDGLVSGFKSLQDALVLGRVIIDDGWEVIGNPEYHWEKAPKGMGRIRIEVWEVT